MDIRIRLSGSLALRVTIACTGLEGDTGEPLFDGGAPTDRMIGLRHFQTLIAAENRLYLAADDAVYAFSF
jgi:hypothetical protein